MNHLYNLQVHFIHLIKVDFPAPLCPTIAKFHCFISMEMLFKTLYHHNVYLNFNIYQFLSLFDAIVYKMNKSVLNK